MPISSGTLSAPLPLTNLGIAASLLSMRFPGFARRFRDQSGAVDLASIMVGVIVLGIVSGIIAATVFVVIPWAQDEAAQQSLEAVATAESTAMVDPGGYQTAAELTANQMLPQSASLKVATDAAADCYVALSQSATGKIYWITNEDQTPQLWQTGDGSSCASVSFTPVDDTMVTTWNTALGTGNTITLPTNGDVNMTVDWGDGSTVQTVTSDYPVHTYATTGTYTVTITGTFDQWGSSAVTNDSVPLTAVTHWGDTGTTSIRYGFVNTENLGSVPSIPSTVTDMYGAFASSNFDGSISGWDTSNVTDMGMLFDGDTAFDQPIGNWDTSKVTDMDNLFNGATAFNQPVDNWDTSAVTDMSYLFSTSGFNQPLADWDTSNVTNMEAMFYSDAVFDQPIGDWNTASVQDMVEMFFTAEDFGQDLSGWNVAAVTSAGLFSLESSMTGAEEPLFT